MEIDSSKNIHNTCVQIDSKTGPVVKGGFVCNGQKLSSASGAESAGTGQFSNESSSNGLSTGAKAGIGVGVVLGVLLLMTLAAVFVIRKRRRSKATPMELSPEYSEKNEAAKLDTSDPIKEGWPSRSHSETWRAELEGSEGTKYELEHPPSQLPAGKDEPVELSEQHGTSELDRRA